MPNTSLGRPPNGEAQPAHNGSLWRQADSLIAIAVTLLSAILLLYRLGDAPLYLFDEARLANNAIEMLTRGDLLVTHFEGAPDLYNTKPPLMIWLMAASMRTFGPTEFALRVPAALAAAATTALVYSFTRAVSGSRTTGVTASLLLLAMAGFVGPHMASSGDYDALLVMFTTAAIAASYFLIEAAMEDTARLTTWAAVLAAAVAGGVLTKGVAGLIVAPGVLLYALWRGALPALVRRPATWLAALAALALPAAFYALREAVAPGYVAAVAYNELTGRAGEALDGHSGPLSYYLQHLFAVWPLRPHAPEQAWPMHVASASPWVWLAPAMILGAQDSPRPSHRHAAVLMALLMISFLAVISVMQTKLPWYLGPLYPWLAILTALGFGALIDRAGITRGPRMRMLLQGGMLATAALGVGLIEARRLREAEYAALVPNGVNGAIIRLLPGGAGNPPLRFINDGYEGGPIKPVAEVFYAKAVRLRGGDARLVGSDYLPRAGELVVWCRPNVKAPPRLRGAVVRRTKACEVVRAAGL